MWPLRNFDWNLRACGLHGHLTYAPDEPELAERLRAEIAAGEAWRCLRCGSYVVGAPHGYGPAAKAPLILRGRALRDAFILRLLAVEKGVRGLLIVLLGYGVWRFDGSRTALRQALDEYLPLLTPLADRLGVDLAETGPVHAIEGAFAMTHGALLWIAIGVTAYGMLNLTEALGLWLMKRWGEYVAAVGTSAFIPLEVYELLHHATTLKWFALLFNLAAITYLVWSKRLFGLRGGHHALEAERNSASLIEIEQAAAEAAA